MSSENEILTSAVIALPSRNTSGNRFIRLRDAPSYVGMNKNLFNKLVRPCLIEIPVGIQGIAFDRLALDNWADEYIGQKGRITSSIAEKHPTRRKKLPDFKKIAMPVTSSKELTAEEFEKAVDELISKKLKNT
jgi:hypothetical protein